MNYAAVLGWIKQEHGLEYSVAQTYPGFNEGVALLHSREGEQLILKKWRQRSLAWAHQARQAIEHGRRNGWPSPDWPLIGETGDGLTFGIQERAVGTPVSTIDNSVAHAIIRVNRLQQGCAFSGTELIDYNARVNSLLSNDYEDWKSRVRSHSDAARQLVDRLLERVTNPNSLSGNDLVHGDYGRTNLLTRDGSISAMVDVDNIGWGNRAGDLMDLYRQMIVMDDPASARLIIRQEVEAIATADGFYAGLAFRTISNLAWGIGAVPERVPEWISKLLAFAQSDEFC